MLHTCASFDNLPTASQLWDPVARPCWVYTLELFFTLSHTLPLYDSHLNTGFLNAELQANWHGIKPTKWLIKFNLTYRKSEYKDFGNNSPHWNDYHWYLLVAVQVGLYKESFDAQVNYNLSWFIIAQYSPWVWQWFDLMQWSSMFWFLPKWEWFSRFMLAGPMLMVCGNNAQLKLLHNWCWCYYWRLK